MDFTQVLERRREETHLLGSVKMRRWGAALAADAQPAGLERRASLRGRFGARGRGHPAASTALGLVGPERLQLFSVAPLLSLAPHLPRLPS